MSSAEAAFLPITVVVADDQRLVRAGFRVILDAEPDIRVVGEAADGAEAVTLAKRLEPAVTLLDIRMPNLDGLAAARAILAETSSRALMLTTFDSDEYVYAALRAGASGFLLKDVPSEYLVTAVRCAARGDALIDPAVTRRLIHRFVHAARPSGDLPPQLAALTARERDVLRQVVRGLSNAEIAEQLVIEENTVKTTSPAFSPNSACATGSRPSSLPTRPASSHPVTDRPQSCCTEARRLDLRDSRSPVRSGETEPMPDEADRELVRSIREALAAVADPTLAPAMQAYMKSAMPYLGVPVPVVRATVRLLARPRLPPSLPALRDTALGLWREAEYREYRYAATELTGLPGLAGLRAPELLPMYAEMVRTGGWWDHTDAIAHQVGEVLRRHRPVVTPQIRAWSRDPDRWLRRLSVICQVGSGADVDTDLLADTVDANAADRDFFLRKGIGWALRDRARADPDWVRAFLASRGDRLSPLSRREAAKHL